MRKIILIVAVLFIIIVSLVFILRERTLDPDNLKTLADKYQRKEKSAADHSKFPELNRKFNSPQEVTETCISCHNERHKEIMQSNHWNWEREEYVEGRGIIHIGKKNAINNFCIGTEGNEKSCAKCHIGFGATDKMQGYSDSTNIDCMVCHDNSETYVKGSEMGGYPDPSVNLTLVAQKVGSPKRTNCGVCHFFGGGGNNVKHGDLEMSMFEPTKEVDVHMAIDGANLQCQACHETKNHMMKGRVYSLSSMNRNRSECEQCHTSTPHEKNILNEHTLKVACQTCHIPVYAKVNSTKTEWDWSTAGKLKDGEPYEEDDSLGNHTYLSIKGSFKWGRNLVPEYQWFNGNASHYLLGDIVNDTSKPLVLNTLHGSYSDPESKIIPVKVHRSIQPFDPVNKMLIQPKLFSDKSGQGALWVDFDWQRAAEVGMKDVNLPYSGKLSFIRTEMNWPVNHMVSAKDKSVQCVECHTKNNSRLAGLTDFYMPGRDANSFVEFVGKASIILTLVGVSAHGLIRILISRKKGKK